MPRYAKIAAVTFDEPGCVDRQLILDQLARNADELAGYGLDLVVFCEGIEACGQTVEQAEQLVVRRRATRERAGEMVCEIRERVEQPGNASKN
jgi:hypothetical protein